MQIKKKSVVGLFVGMALSMFGTFQQATALVCNCSTESGNKVIEFNSATTIYSDCKAASSATISGKATGSKETVDLKLKKCIKYDGSASVDFKTND